MEKWVNGKRLAYLDNAATSQKPRQVIDAVTGYYENYNANIHRGIYKIAEDATAAYADSKTARSRADKRRLLQEHRLSAEHHRGDKPRGEDLGRGEPAQGRPRPHNRDGAPQQHSAVADAREEEGREARLRRAGGREIRRHGRLQGEAQVAPETGIFHPRLQRSRDDKRREGDDPARAQGGRGSPSRRGAVRASHARGRKGNRLRLHGFLKPQDARALQAWEFYTARKNFWRGCRRSSEAAT